MSYYRKKQCRVRGDRAKDYAWKIRERVESVVLAQRKMEAPGFHSMLCFLAAAQRLLFDPFSAVLPLFNRVAPVRAQPSRAISDSGLLMGKPKCDPVEDQGPPPCSRSEQRKPRYVRMAAVDVGKPDEYSWSEEPRSRSDKCSGSSPRETR